MNVLEQFYIQLDQSDWDVRQESEINQSLQEVNESLVAEGLNDVQHFAEIDRQAFHFSKSPEKRLSYRAAGTRNLEDGSIVPFEWPDIRIFTEKDFGYLFTRFKASKNLYAKTEYGLVLFYAKYKQDNDFVIELLNSLFLLAKRYKEKALPNGDKNHYILQFRIVLANALFIANNRKASQEVEAIYKSLIEYSFEVHQIWDVKHSSALRTVIDLTDFAIQYIKDFSKYVDLKKINEKNWIAARYLTGTYTWGAIYTADVSIKLCKHIGIDTKEWQEFKAKHYEKLAIESKEKNNMAAVSFIEKAMSIYKGIKDETNLHRLETEYQKIRADFKLGQVSQEMPQDETKRITEHIRKIVKESNEEGIVATLMLTPMLRPLTEIRQWSEDSFKETMLQNILPVSIQDKFGNTIANYSSDEERKSFSLLRTYEFHFQIASQTIIQFLIESLKANKLSAKSILALLEQTWLNKEAKRKSNGIEANVNYLGIISPGIKLLFSELEKWKTESGYTPDFVCATDSLILKSEYLLREFCMLLGVPTFKPNPKKPNIIMEKTLDDLLRDLEGKLNENDLFFIKFVLTEKAGFNLRNRIAHGLLDNIDYGLDYPIYALLIILKLSNYQFEPSKN
ncbi:MAG: DUF4209 domain-containing protein [Bacteroidota bacterium]|nr:DUF4209 domain-containing protein [Bacteroidota bacterium]